MIYALVNGNKASAQPGLRGICPDCGAHMTPKCGVLHLKQWHWAHPPGSECDPWSEPTGPWHLSWQQPLLPDHVEVSIPPHRADIKGKGNVVIELQHSPISAEEIQERERFYGNMVWLFDATYRFRFVRSGNVAFFAFGRTKHIDQCQKPVFLDFGHVIVQVERFTNIFPGCSGIGHARDRDSFVAEYLYGCVRHGAEVLPATSDSKPMTNPWDRKCPYHAMKHESYWIDPVSGERKVVAKKSPCLRLNYVWRSDKRPLYYDIIEQFPSVSLAWEKTELHDMIELLSGMAVILDGQLRVMPERADKMRVQMPVSAATALLTKAERHIAAGRIPVLSDTTKAKIISLAEEYERRTYGKLLSPPTAPNPKPNKQATLFD